MRIGTWNLAGRWDGRQEHLIRMQNCDVWLLTEVSERLFLDDYFMHRTIVCMAQKRRWAAILSREPLVGHADPHPASALAGVGNMRFCSSILPWRSCGDRHPWVGTRHADKTKATIQDLLGTLPHGNLIWGGDWNHALSGPEFAGSQEGRRHILAAVTTLGLKVPTAALPHQLPNLLSIDHIAVPKGAIMVTVDRVEAIAKGLRLSDHDAYIVEIR